MTSEEFRMVAETRARDAEAALDSGRWSAAFYLSGYAVECALKAKICLAFKEHDLPTVESVRKVYVHKLEELVKIAQLDIEGPEVQRAWAVAKNWTEQARYQLYEEAEAREMVSNANQVTKWILSSI